VGKRGRSWRPVRSERAIYNAIEIFHKVSSLGLAFGTTDKSFVRWQKQPVFTRIPLTLYITSSLLTGLETELELIVAALGDRQRVGQCIRVELEERGKAGVGLEVALVVRVQRGGEGR